MSNIKSLKQFIEYEKSVQEGAVKNVIKAVGRIPAVVANAVANPLKSATDNISNGVNDNDIRKSYSAKDKIKDFTKGNHKNTVPLSNVREEKMISFKKFVSEPTIAEWTQARMMSNNETEFMLAEDRESSSNLHERSDHPSYDKRASYAMYGTPDEDKEGTKNKIAAENENRKKEGKNPLSSSQEKYHKVFKHVTDGSRGGIAGIFKTYGDSDKKIISPEERRSEVSTNFDKFSELKKNNPEKYKSKVSEMKARKKAAGLGDVLSNKTKTDTAAALPGTNKGEEKGQLSHGFGGNADTRRLYTDTKGSHVEGNACVGKGSCVHKCLAKMGCGGFDTTKGYRDAYDQRPLHNAASREDHDLELHDHLHKISEQAKKEGKGSLVRPDVSTGHQNIEYSDAIHKHFGPDSEKVKSGEGHPIRVSAYGKNSGTDTDRHTGPDKNTVISDQKGEGSKSNIDRYTRDNELMRQKGKHSRISYSVTDASFGPGEGGEHGEGVHKNKDDQAKLDKTKKVTHVHRYDVQPSEPTKGEDKEYHDEKSGYGRVVAHDGKSYKYSIHKVPKAIKSVEGKHIPSYMHDDRSGELARHHIDHPNDHGINAVAPATAATTPEAGKASIFHSSDNIKPHHNQAKVEAETGIKDAHILHMMHPNSTEAIKARETLAKHELHKKIIPIGVAK